MHPLCCIPFSFIPDYTPAESDYLIFQVYYQISQVSLVSRSSAKL